MNPLARLQTLCWWPRHLYQQLMAMMSALLLLALGLLGGYTAHEQTLLGQQATEKQVAALARTVAISSANLILTDSLDGLEELALRSAELADVRAVRVLGRRGEPLAQVVRPADEAPRVIYDHRLSAEVHPPATQDTPLPALRPHADGIEAWHPVMAGEQVGWVQVVHDTRGLQHERARIWRNTAVVAVMAILLCMWLLWMLLRRPMRGLTRARAFAREMVDAKGRLLPREPGPAEFVELVDSLNEASMVLCQQMILLEHQVAELHAHEAQLADQNEQLGALFRLSQDGLVTFDRAGRVRFVNQAFLRLTGLQEAEVQGCEVTALSALLAQRLRDASAFPGLASVFANESQGEAVQVRLQGDGARTLSLTGQCSAHGGVSRVLFVGDVTRQRQLDDMKSEFLSMAAHELRTPMVSIFGFTELMLKRDMPAEQRQDLLGRIHRHSQSMVSILNELLDLARIEARRGQDFRIEPLVLDDVVAAVVQDFKPAPGRSAPAWQEAAQPSPVRADRHKLQQAVLNILSNAYKYSPQGGEVSVRLLHHTDDEGVSWHGVVIEDHGMGLSAEHVQRLSSGERFFRADKSGNIPGTGLGVSIVKELMELMGGRMVVDSELGVGTRVTLWLRGA